MASEKSGNSISRISESPCLSHPAGAERNLRRADVGRLRQNIARRQHRRHMLGFMDRIFADLVALTDGKDLIHARGVVLERQREGENLEHRAQLVDILGHHVSGGVTARQMPGIGIEIRHRDHGEHFAAIDVHHHAAGRLGVEGFARRFRLMRQDVLHPHVDGGRHLTAGMGLNLLFQPQFKTGDTVIVGIGDAQKLRGGALASVIDRRGVIIWRPRSSV